MNGILILQPTDARADRFGESVGVRLARLVALCIIPVLVLILPLDWRRKAGEFWVGTNWDPAYHYLFSGLSLATGRSTSMYLHPGTPLSVLAAITLRVHHAVAGENDLETDVLADPESHLTSIHVALLCCVALAIFAAGYLAWRGTGKLRVGLALQATPFVHLLLLLSFGTVRLEPLLMAAILVFAALVLVWVKDPDRVHPTSWGILIGTLLAIKLTACLFFLAPLFLVRTWRGRLVYAATAGLTLLAWLLPLWGKLPEMCGWYLRVAGHTGLYGSGHAGVVDWQAYLPNLWKLLRDTGLLGYVVFACCGLAALAWHPALSARLSPEQRRARWALCVVVLGQLAQYFLVAKQPRLLYLVPAYSLAGLVAILFWHLLAPIPAWKGGALRLAGCLLAVLLVHRAGTDYRMHRTWAAQRLREATASTDSVPAEATLVCGYGGSSRALALEEGNYLAGSHFTHQLAATEPDAVFYDIWNNEFYTFGRKKLAAAEVFARDRPVYLLCYALEKPWPEWGFPEGLPYEPAVTYTKVSDIGVHRRVYHLEYRPELATGEPARRSAFRIFD